MKEIKEGTFIEVLAFSQNVVTELNFVSKSITWILQNGFVRRVAYEAATTLDRIGPLQQLTAKS